jgi:23S rRNA pseudouridine1911/1915/1917 synthase
MTFGERKRLHERIEVVYEDRDLLVIFKAAGILTYPVENERGESAIQLIRRYWKSQRVRNEHLYLIHRLDKETSGLLVFAKSSLARESLHRQFEEHSIIRCYLAITDRAPERSKGEIRTRLGRNPRGKRAVARFGKLAITRYEVLKSSRNRTLIRCELVTGRTHQIRIHLAHLGAPVVGDSIYGKGKAQRMALHAEALGFHHPRSHQAIVFRTSLPADLKKLI